MNAYRKQSIWQGLILLLFSVMILVVAPIYAGAAVRFVVVGDTRGPNHDNPINIQILGEIVDAVVNENAEFIIVTGDLVHGYTSAANLESQLTQWREIMKELKNAGMGVYPCRGNHDLNAQGQHDAAAKKVWDDVFASWNLPNNGPPGEKNISYSFSIENVLIVALDTYINPHRINQAWLNQQFEGNNQQHVFVFAHEPAFSVRHDDCLDDYPDERNAFWNSLACEGGRIYFTGHDHSYNHARIGDGDENPDNDLHQFVVGTGGAPIKNWDGNYDGNNGHWKPEEVFHEENYGYVVVEIEGRNVTATWKHRTNPGSYVSGGDIFSYNSTSTTHFQDGVSPNTGYLGTRDTTLSQAHPNSNFGNDINLYVDGDDPPPTGNDLSTLIKWNISFIPPNSHISGGCFTSYVSNKTNDTYEIYEVKRDWQEDEATWNQYSSSSSWQLPGALGTKDRGVTPLALFSPGKIGTHTIGLNKDGVALVQSWVDNPPSNHGLITADSSANDGVDFDSREVSAKSNRPRLTVHYTDEDSLSYTPVKPCRIVDTRKAGGAISADGIRSYNVRGAVASQGGNSAGCPAPKGEPLAVHVNVTSVPLSNGWIAAYPYGSTAPTASLVNYRSDAQNVANSGTVKTCSYCTKDLNVKSGGGATQVIIDVLGYYYATP